MRLSALVPSWQRSDITRPDIMLFGPLQREIDRLFDEFSRGVAPLQQTAANLRPTIDVAETDKDIEVTVEMPGLERGDVEISLEDNVLTIRGEKRTEADRNRKNVHVCERAYGVLLRTIELPPGVDPSSIDATMANGVLNICIPKPKASEPKKIEVKESHPAPSQHAEASSSQPTQAPSQYVRAGQHAQQATALQAQAPQSQSPSEHQGSAYR